MNPFSKLLGAAVLGTCILFGGMASAEPTTGSADNAAEFVKGEGKGKGKKGKGRKGKGKKGKKGKGKGEGDKKPAASAA